ncbi:MAG: D-2-hydroxyacid dehydrogenase [Termitinemataceae bacterium]
MNQHANMIVLTLPEHRLPKEARERIQALAPDRAVHIVPDKQKLEALIETIEVAAGEFPPSLLPRARHLKWYQSWYAGADWLDRVPETKNQPFVLTNTSGIHGVQMTEHLFGMLISWYRHFPEAFAAKTQHQWLSFSYSDMDVLAGKTLLIIGYGTIGRRIGQIAQAFDMKVIGIKRTSPVQTPENGVDVDVYAHLDRHLAQADIVVNILPLTAETRNFYNKDFFARMKRHALFVNIGRGGSVHEANLIEALEAGTIGGALLDVTAEEPLPSNSPLWEAPRIMITSHFSGFHPQYDELAFQVFLANLAKYVRGEALLNVVDKQLGY